MPLVLSDDAWMQIGLHLKPRHLYKLMCANKRIKLLVDNEIYWTRVAAHLCLRDHWMIEVYSPHCEDNIPSNRILPPLEASHYYMVGLDQGYFRAMQCFMQRIQDSIEAYTLLGDEDDLEYVSRFHGCTLGTAIQSLIADYRRTSRTPPGVDTMKDLARYGTISFWKTRKDLYLGEDWPKIQKFLCQLEDDPMPAKYKRQVFRSMWEAFGPYMTLFGTGKLPFIGESLCIF
jgi:hypothetical protein